MVSVRPIFSVYVALNLLTEEVTVKCFAWKSAKLLSPWKSQDPSLQGSWPLLITQNPPVTESQTPDALVMSLVHDAHLCGRSETIGSSTKDAVLSRGLLLTFVFVAKVDKWLLFTVSSFSLGKGSQKLVTRVR